jgi:hypothetical protein
MQGFALHNLIRNALVHPRKSKSRASNADQRGAGEMLHAGSMRIKPVEPMPHALCDVCMQTMVVRSAARRAQRRAEMQ